MATPRRKNRSGDKFSFPIMPLQDQGFEFEFGCPMPGSPGSPADHLFFNGRLLPHAFPVFQPACSAPTYMRSGSRTSSASSKDSLMSSRSNSRSSSCSSARTSTSEASERKPFMMSQLKSGAGGSRAAGAARQSHHQANNHALAPQCGSSRKWQFITPAPVLNHQGRHRKRADHQAAGLQQQLRVENNQGKRKARAGSGLGRRFFRSLVSACRECHAMKPSVRDDVLQRRVDDPQ